MSERGRSLPALPERADEEVMLNTAQEETLRQSLRTLPMPLTGEDFNARLTGALRAGHDFRPLPEQILTRLRWMSLPAFIGFTVTLVAVQMGVPLLTGKPVMPSRVVQFVPPPPLPPLPLNAIPAPRPEVAKSAPVPAMKGERR
jgi:hypothetical protein